MPVPTQGKARLERALISIHRAGRARGTEGRKYVAPATRPGAERPAPAVSAPPVGHELRPEAVSHIAVGHELRPEAGTVPPEESEAASAALPASAALLGSAVPPAPEDGLTEIVDRLSNIEERLAAIQEAPRPRAATPELFAEWVRMRHWQEIPFVEFLKLRRAGRI